MRRFGLPGWALIGLMTVCLGVAVWAVLRDGAFGGREQSVRITADNIAFDTGEIATKVGQATTVEVINEDSVPHAFTSDPFDVELLVESKTSGEVTLTPSEAGNFAFYCKLHPQIMVGTISVGD